MRLVARLTQSFLKFFYLLRCRSFRKKFKKKLMLWSQAYFEANSATAKNSWKWHIIIIYVHIPFVVNWPLELQYIRFRVKHMAPVSVCTKYSNFFQTIPENFLKIIMCFLLIPFKLLAKYSKCHHPQKQMVNRGLKGQGHFHGKKSRHKNCIYFHVTKYDYCLIST